MKLTYLQQSGSPPVGGGGDQYTGLDRFGRVIDQRWIKESSGADLERVEYGFDRASNRVWRDNAVADALSAQQDEFYTYDRLNQLLTLQRGTLNVGKTGIAGTPTWAEDLTFDPTGNWQNYVNQVNGMTTLNQPRTHNAANEVKTISGSSALMVQNAAGNMSKVPQPTDWSSAYDLAYDAWQRPVEIKNGSTNVAAYAYDGQSRRTIKTIGTTTRHYYYSSQWQILEERLNTAATADRQFVWGLMGLDNLVLRDRGAERFYSIQDVFSCTAIVDMAGTVRERYGYNAFGLPRVMDADFNLGTESDYDWETRYANYRFDNESSFYQVRNRYLHPTLGRWLTRDPIEYGDGINLYAYVWNNSVNSIDFSGLMSIQSCNNAVTAGQKNPKAKKLLGAIASSNCPTPTFTCCNCPGSEGGSTDPSTGNITFCANNTSDSGGTKASTVIIENVTHELVHSLDRCLKKDCFSDCKCRACSEIKAYDQSGACAKGGSHRGSFKTYRECIKYYAWQSTKVSPTCTMDDVTSQLSTCIGLPVT
jgi:RHS repeat-associated protein